MIPIRAALFFLLLLAPFATSTDFYRQTLTTPPDAYPYLAAQELLSMLPPIPNILQVSTEQSLTDDPTASSDWTNPKGQDQATLRDLLYQGVRSFQFDVHYIAELEIFGQVTTNGLRVCKSVTSQVDVGALCSGSLNEELGIVLDEDTCRTAGVFPKYGIHAGCPPNSPLLEDVLNAFDLWVGEGNPAAVTIRFKDFTTAGFVPESAEDSVQDRLDFVLRTSLRGSLYVPEDGVDYNDVDNWPSFSDVTGGGERIIIFSNSTISPLVFDDSLLNEENFESSTRRAIQPPPSTSSSSKSKRQVQPFFDYTIDSSDRIVIQGTIITESGETILSTDVPSILSDDRIPSIQRLSDDHLDNLVWGFVEPFNFSDTLACVVIDPSQSFGWYRSSCDENYAVACSSGDSASFEFGQVTSNNYESADGDSFCPDGFQHSAPSSPFQNQEFVSDANGDGITEPVYVNLRFATEDCGCDDGCWWIPDSGISGLPSTSFCVVPQIEIPIPDDSDTVDSDDDDDDLSGGQIAAIVLGSVFFFLLVLLLLLLLCFARGGQKFNEVSGRVGVVVEEEEEDERYKQSRGPLTTADTTVATNIEYPDHKMDLDAQVDMGIEEEDKGPANKRKIGALEVSSQSMRDYRSGLDEKK